MSAESNDHHVRLLSTVTRRFSPGRSDAPGLWVGLQSFIIIVIPLLWIVVIFKVLDSRTTPMQVQCFAPDQITLKMFGHDRHCEFPEYD